MSRLLVTLCTYNERDNLARLVPEIHRHAPDADVLVIYALVAHGREVKSA